MAEQENTQLVRQAYDRYKSGDIQGLLDLMADDIVWDLPVMENVPFSGARRGKDSVAQFFTDLDQLQHPLEFEPHEFIAQGDNVVALGHYVWSVKPTDRRFESDWAHIFTIEGGKVSRFREFTDTAAGVAAYKPA